MALNYAFVAATGEHIIPWMLCYSYVFLALIVFDTLLSLPSEINHIWCKKPRVGSSLYIVAHYSTLAVFFIDIYENFFVTSLEVCENKGSHL